MSLNFVHLLPIYWQCDPAMAKQHLETCSIVRQIYTLSSGLYRRLIANKSLKWGELPFLTPIACNDISVIILPIHLIH